MFRRMGKVISAVILLILICAIPYFSCAEEMTKASYQETLSLERWALIEPYFKTSFLGFNADGTYSFVLDGWDMNQEYSDWGFTYAVAEDGSIECFINDTTLALDNEMIILEPRISSDGFIYLETSGSGTIKFARESEAENVKADSSDSRVTIVQGTAAENTPPQATEQPAVSQDFGIWSLHFYVDEFNDETDEWYILANATGTFSNSATTNSELLASILIEWGGNHNYIVLYEYGDHKVTNPFSKPAEYNVAIKDGDGTVYRLTGTMVSDRIELNGQFFDILRHGGKFSFAITEAGNSLTKYNFSISDASKLTDIYAYAYNGLYKK